MKTKTLAIAVSTAMLLAACGGADDDAAETPPAAEVTIPTKDERPGDTTSPAADGGVDADATIVFAYQNPITPATFDPHKAPSNNDAVPLGIIYDTVIISDADDNLVPGLATEWGFSEDGSTFTLTLRDGATFHDGTPVNAAAIKANIERAETVEGSMVAGSYAAVTSIETPSDTEVLLHLDGGGVTLPSTLSGLAGMIINPADFDSPDLDLLGSGSGMYKIARHEKDSRIVFDRYEDYWDPAAAQAAHIELLIQPDAAARVNSLISGQVDVAARVSPDVYAQAAAADNVVLYEKATTEFWHFWMNRSAVLEDPLVREAIAHAIDKEGIVAAALQGRGVVAHQAVPESSPFFSDELGEPYPYDPEKAKELLAEAGYPDGVDIRFLAYAVPSYIRMNEIIQAQLEQVGFRVSIEQTTEVAKFFRGEADAAPSQGLYSADPTQGFYDHVAPDGNDNGGGHSTPAVEAALAEALKAQPDEEHVAAVQNLIQAISDDILMIPIYFELITTGSSDQIVGLEARADGRVSFRGVGKLAG